MNSLIIDCSSGMSLFVLRGNDVFSYVNYEIKKHTDELLLKLDELLKQAELKINEIDNLCVCVGPGSFTGIRVAISIVKGIAVSGKFKIFTLSNFDIYDTKTINFGVLVLEGFSNNVYVRVFDNELIIDKILNPEYRPKQNMWGYDFAALYDSIFANSHKFYSVNLIVEPLNKYIIFKYQSKIELYWLIIIALDLAQDDLKADCSDTYDIDKVQMMLNGEGDKK